MSAVGNVLGGAMNLLTGGGWSKPTPAPLPQVQAPVVMPLPDDAAAQAARKKQVSMLEASGGRASTILTSQVNKGTAPKSDTLG